jgi:hypothetical protein
VINQPLLNINSAPGIVLFSFLFDQFLISLKTAQYGIRLDFTALAP